MLRPMFLLAFLITSGAPAAAESLITPWGGVAYGLRKDITYRQELQLDAYLPANPVEAMPAVVFIHGGAWIAGSKDLPMSEHCAWALLDEGIAVFAINYNLAAVPDAEAPWTTGRFPRNLLDAKSAVQHVRAHASEYRIDPERIAVAGASAGGHLALLVGLTGDDPYFQPLTDRPEVSTSVSAVINLYGITDTRAWGTAALVRDDSPQADRLVALAAPILYLRPTSPPILTIHGTDDPTVSFEHALLLEEAATKAGAPHEMVPVEGGLHGFPFGPHQQNNRTDLRPRVAEFLEQHL